MASSLLSSRFTEKKIIYIYIYIHRAILFHPDEIFRQTDTFPNSRCCNGAQHNYSVLRVSFLQEMSKRALFSDVRDCNYVGKFGAASETAGNEFFMIKTRRYPVLPYRSQTSDTQYSAASSHLSEKRKCYTTVRHGAHTKRIGTGSCDVATSCSAVEALLRFAGTCYLDLQGRTVSLRSNE
jgi:hypothetical protein